MAKQGPDTDKGRDTVRDRTDLCLVLCSRVTFLLLSFQNTLLTILKQDTYHGADMLKSYGQTKKACFVS